MLMIKTVKIPEIEIVQKLEARHKTPSYEEFMKDYRRDEEISYTDLIDNDLGTLKGYGPRKGSSCSCDCSSRECICNNYTKYNHSGEWKKKNPIKIRINKKTRIKGFQHLIHTGNDWADKSGDQSIESQRKEFWDSEEAISIDDNFRVFSVKTSAGANVGMGGYNS